jgi:hypothetical protein
MSEVWIGQLRLHYEAEGDGPHLKGAIRTGW